MGTLRGTVLCVFSALYLATAMPAQEGSEGALQVPGGLLHAGATITIAYSNPEAAGDVIIVQVYEEEDDEGDVVLIPVGPDGTGYGHWTVREDWDGAFFNAPGAGESARMIVHQY